MKDESKTLSDYIELLQSRGEYCLIKQKATETLGVSDLAFRKAAYRLIRKGKLNRIRGSFFVIVPPEYRATGSLPAAWFINDLMKYLKQSYYSGLLSAAALHEASHQQPMAFQVITNKPTRPITVGQVRIEFYYKKIILPNFYQPIKTPSGTMNISTPEMTAFDLVKYMSAAGQINHVATVLYELANQLNSFTLTELLKNNEIEITAAQRLGYLLDILSLGVDLESFHKEFKRKKNSRRLLVVGGNSPIIEHNQRWNILVNEKVQVDEI